MRIDCLKKRLLKIPKDKGFMTAAVSILISTNGKILFIKRKSSPKDPWSSHIAFPGGRWEPADDSLLATAIRECKEETGLDLRFIGEVIGACEPTSPGNMPELRVVPIVFIVNKEDELKVGPEVERAFWIPIGHLIVNERYIKIGKWKGIAYKINREVIWGMTARILRKLLPILIECGFF